LAAIRRKENEIYLAQETIRRLEVKYEQQESAYQMYNWKVEEFEDLISRKRAKAEAVAAHSPKNNLADKYAITIDTVVNGSSWYEQKSNMIDISTNMERDIRNTGIEISDERSQLSNLRTQLANLQADYRRALSQELSAKK